MVREFKTRRAIEQKPLVYNLPVVNALICFGIIFFSVFTLFAGISVIKIVCIVLVDLLSYIVLSTINEKKIRAFRKKHFVKKAAIKINSYKPFK